MSSGEARKSTSATFFGNVTGPRAINEQTKKRTRLELEQPNVPSITITNNNTIGNTDGEGIAIKLNRLTDKCCRYKSHKSFLDKCKAENQIPAGLQLSLEPSIGNQDEEFLNTWYGKLDECSVMFMDMVIEFCNKTITSLEGQKAQTKEALNKSMQSNDYEEVIGVINSNEKEQTEVLQQRKSKKFNYLKYHKGKAQDRQPSTGGPQEYPRYEKQFAYTEAEQPRDRRQRNTVNRRFDNKRPSNSNFNSYRRNNGYTPSNTNLTIKERLQNTKWNGPRRTNSNISAKSNEAVPQQQVGLSSNEFYEFNTTRNNNTNEQSSSNMGGPSTFYDEPAWEEVNSKNPFLASERRGRHLGKQTNATIKPSDIISYIEATMETLKSFAEQFKTQDSSAMTRRD